MSDWYCRYCSHYTSSNRCTCDDLEPPLSKRELERERKRKLKDLKDEIDELREKVKKLKKAKPEEVQVLLKKWEDK